MIEGMVFAPSTLVVFGVWYLKGFWNVLLGF